jgi:hypothetical protein
VLSETSDISVCAVCFHVMKLCLNDGVTLTVPEVHRAQSKKRSEYRHSGQKDVTG